MDARRTRRALVAARGVRGAEKVRGWGMRAEKLGGCFRGAADDERSLEGVVEEQEDVCREKVPVRVRERGGAAPAIYRSQRA